MLVLPNLLLTTRPIPALHLTQNLPPLRRESQGELVIMRMKKREIWADAQGSLHVTMEAGTEVAHLQVKQGQDLQQLPGNSAKGDL